MSEPIAWRKENAVSTSPMPSMATYTDAMNKFTKSAKGFMEHVYLLQEAQDAYKIALATSASIHDSLDASDQALRSLMTQMEQVINAHLGEATPDKKKPEAVKVEPIRTNGESTASSATFLP